MARKYYIGKLGKFKYDNTEFKLINGYLRYIGAETDGSKIKIPKGITNCGFMFCGCSSLIEPPEIPVGVTDCISMFYGCVSLTKAPEIPEGVTYCLSMFSGCKSLVRAPEIPVGADCDCMFLGCSSLKNYSFNNAPYRNEMYCSCPPSIIQEIDSFVQKFKERNQLND